MNVTFMPGFLHKGLHLQEFMTKISKAVNLNLFGKIFILFSIVIYLSTVDQNLLESHDFTIPLRSNGNQALETVIRLVHHAQIS